MKSPQLHHKIDENETPPCATHSCFKLVHPWQVVAQAWAGGGVWRLEIEEQVSCWKYPHVSHNKDTIKKRGREAELEENERYARARLFSINSHLRLYIRWCMYPTPSLYWATYRDIPWCLLVEAYLFRTNAMIRWMTSNIILVTCLEVGVATVLFIGSSYWYVISPHISY